MIQDQLASYDCRTGVEEQQTIREISQEVVLASLGPSDFFKHALFQGVTCLRIFDGLNRFMVPTEKLRQMKQLWSAYELRTSFRLGRHLPFDSPTA